MYHPLKFIIGNYYHGAKGIVVWPSDTMLSHKDMATKMSIIPRSAGFCTVTATGGLHIFGESETLGVNTKADDVEWMKSFDLTLLTTNLLRVNMLNCKEQTPVLFYPGVPLDDLPARYLNRLFINYQDCVPVTNLKGTLDKAIEVARDQGNKYERRKWH